MECKPIGLIHTPYSDRSIVPYQPVETEDDEGTFFVEVNSEFADGLYRLDTFAYVYLLYHVDRVKRPVTPRVTVSWAYHTEVGVFASRSPVRPNPIGLSVVRILKIEGNRLYTSGLDVFDGTPLLDIKPYLRDLDAKQDANYGWIEDLPDRDHLMLHIKGIPHDY